MSSSVANTRALFLEAGGPGKPPPPPARRSQATEFALNYFTHAQQRFLHRKLPGLRPGWQWRGGGFCPSQMQNACIWKGFLCNPRPLVIVYSSEALPSPPYRPPPHIFVCGYLNRLWAPSGPFLGDPTRAHFYDRQLAGLSRILFTGGRGALNAGWFYLQGH